MLINEGHRTKRQDMSDRRGWMNVMFLSQLENLW